MTPCRFLSVTLMGQGGSSFVTYGNDACVVCQNNRFWADDARRRWLSAVKNAARSYRFYTIQGDLGMAKLYQDELDAVLREEPQ